MKEALIEYMVCMFLIFGSLILTAFAISVVLMAITLLFSLGADLYNAYKDYKQREGGESHE